MRREDGIVIDNSPRMGIPWMTIENKSQSSSVMVNVESVMQIDKFQELENRILLLEGRVYDLESRTWWSMLKEQIRKIFN